MRTVPFGVAVVNWNGRDDTLACLESLHAADPRPARVVVADNASTDGSAAALAAWGAAHPDAGLEVVASQVNRGFAGGCNVGLGRLVSDARLSHFLLLNNDATLEPGALAAAELALAEAPATGILGLTVYGNGRGRSAWYAGGSISTWRAIGRHHRTVPVTDRRVLDAGFVSGCAMLISRGAWEALGPLPEAYFLYFEDAEYCLRARAAGIRIGYAPRAAVCHRVAGTYERGAVAAPVTERRFARSRALFARRNLRGATRWIAACYLLGTGLAKAVLRTFRGRPIRAWAAFGGTVEGLLAIDGDREAAQAAAAERAGERALVDQ